MIRIEQLYPLADQQLTDLLKAYPKVKKFVWVQEEPRNGGAWSHLRPILADLLGKEPEYVGRDEAASPAVGSHKLHQHEQQELVQQALKQ